MEVSSEIDKDGIRIRSVSWVGIKENPLGDAISIAMALASNTLHRDFYASCSLWDMDSRIVATFAQQIQNVLVLVAARHLNDSVKPLR
jgi:hypothetical protein